MALLEKQKQQRISVPSRVPPPHPLTKTILNTGPVETDGSGKNHELVVTVNRDRRDVVDLKSPSTASNLQQVAQHQKKRFSDPLVKRVLINNTVTAERENVLSRESNSLETRDTQPPLDKATAPSEMEMLDNIGRKENYRIENAIHEPEFNSALKKLPSLKKEARLEVLKIAENRFEKHR